MNEEVRINDIVKRIKNRRSELMLSYQDLADKTGLNKSTLQRYETGTIKNMPLDKLEVLANALEISPAYLMGWQDTESANNTKHSNSILEKKLLSDFNKLNDIGKNKACERVYELTLIQQYSNSIETKAAHNDYLHEEGELDRMNEDFEDMKKW